VRVEFWKVTTIPGSSVQLFQEMGEFLSAIGNRKRKFDRHARYLKINKKKKEGLKFSACLCYGRFLMTRKPTIAIAAIIATVETAKYISNGGSAWVCSV
jgi:hypothetical protein